LNFGLSTDFSVQL